MADLIERLRRHLDEDERVALAGAASTMAVGDWKLEANAHVDPIEAHIARHDPARVLRWVAAARQILVIHPKTGSCCDACSNDQWVAHWPCPTLLALASIYGEEP